MQTSTREVLAETNGTNTITFGGVFIPFLVNAAEGCNSYEFSFRFIVSRFVVVILMRFSNLTPRERGRKFSRMCVLLLADRQQGIRRHVLDMLEPQKWLAVTNDSHQSYASSVPHRGTAKGDVECISLSFFTRQMPFKCSSKSDLGEQNGVELLLLSCMAGQEQGGWRCRFWLPLSNHILSGCGNIRLM